MNTDRNKPDGFFGHRLAWCMRELDLNVAQLAALVGCSTEHVRKMISGRVLPSAGLIRRLATSLRQRYPELVSLANADRGRKKLQNFYPMLGLKKEYEPFYFVWDYLDAEQKEILYRAAEIYARAEESKRADHDMQEERE